MLGAKISALITEADAVSIELHKKALAGIRAGDSIDAVYQVARRIAPAICGGLYEQTSSSDPLNITDTIFDVSQEYLQNMMLNLEHDPTMEVAIAAEEGLVVYDTDILPENEEAEIKEIFDYKKYNLNQIFLIKIKQSASPRDVLHEYFVFFTARGEARVGDWEKAMLKLLCADMRQAICRSRLPIIPDQPILHQIFQERKTGYLCVRKTGAVCEVNRQAYNLIHDYYPFMARRPGNVCIREFVDRIMTDWGRGFPSAVCIASPDGHRYLSINKHTLSARTHHLPEDMVLITLDESLIGGGPNNAAKNIYAELTERQREITNLLFSTGMTFKELALALGISEGTMRKHAENIYRILGVHSRRELMILLKSGRN